MDVDPQIRVLLPPLSDTQSKAIRDQLTRVVSHPLFRNSKRYPRFLRYVTERALVQQTDDLKERTIGIEVFGQPSDYDTSDNPVVRYCASETRKRLALYYQLEEHRNELRIGIQPGRYVPEFSICTQAPRCEDDHRHVGLIKRGSLNDLERRSSEIRLAVLSFENLNVDGNDSFTDGITEQVICRFGILREYVTVIAPPSILHPIPTFKSARQLCRELKTNFLLAGSTLRLEGQVRVNARLIGADGGCIWTNSYVCDGPQTLVVQDQIAYDVVQHLARVLQIPLFPRNDVSPAQQALGLAMHLLEQRTESSVLKAIEQFRRTLTFDKHLAHAHSGLAFALLTNVWLGGDTDGGRVYSFAADEAQRALDLAPDLSAPYLTLAMLQHAYNFNDTAAEQSCRCALSTDAHSLHANLFLAFLHTTNGRFDEALTTAQRARASDPYSAYVQGFTAFNSYCSRRYEEAIKAAEAALEFDNNFPTALSTMGMALEETGQAALAVERYQQGLRLHPSSRLFLSLLGRAFALQGKKQEAAQILEALMKGYKRDCSSAYPIALIYNALGKTDDALQWLDRSFADRCFSRVICRVDPRLENLRGTSRFKSMLLKAEDDSEAGHTLFVQAAH